MNTKLGKLLLFVAVTLIFLPAFPHPTFAQVPLFGPQTEYVAGSKNGPSGIAVGDFNGDGKLDLAVVNFGDWNIYVLLGNGDGTFQPARSVYIASGGGFPWYVVAADFNGDGKLDLAVSNYGDNSISVLLGNGDGTFQAPQTTPVSTNPAQVAVGDFNGDGKLDLAVSSVANNNVSVLLGNGDGTFQAPLVTPAGANPWYFAVGDFTGNGKLDLAVADYGCPLDCNSSPSNTVTVLLGNGDGTFLPGSSLTVGNGPAGVAVADFNGDGKLDLAVTNLNDNTVSVLLGNGDGTFQTPQTFSDPGIPHPYFVAVGDFNGDGKPDLVISNELDAPTVSVLLGKGDGTFQPAQDFAVDNDPVFVAVSALSGNGGLDLAVANLHTLNISVLLGTAGSLSTLTLNPSTVTGGTSATGTVTLSGSAPSAGAVVNLSSSNTGVATVPASVTVPGGNTSATFPVTTGPVGTVIPVTISGSYNGNTQSATLTVNPSTLASLTLNPSSVTGGLGSSTGTVTLNVPAPAGGAQVTLSSSNTSAATVPASVTVPGGSTSATFPVTTSPVGTVIPVTISGSYNGNTQSATLTVNPPTLTSLTLNPSSVVGGVGSSTGTVTLNAPAPAGGAKVTLSSSNPSTASVPSSVTIPAGATSATFTVDTSIVVISTTVTISGSYNTTRSATLNVTL
jgi:FG-GAP-like repeat